MRRYFLIIFIIIFSGMVMSNCARRGRPMGGEKDETAPILAYAKPDHESIHFNAKKVRIYFDEYIKLKDLNKQLVVSPPLKYNPIVTPVGSASKFINISILDTLNENTTYTFNFGNSVVDNNEGNILSRFKYVFSTGDYIDSLTVSGSVTDAFNAEPDENIAVLLYEINESFNDSIIYKEKPSYVTNTLDTTNFDLTNLRAGKYLLMALKDVNNNYLFNPKEDKIGFFKDTISIPTDTTYHITLFKEILDFKLMKPKEINKGHVIFGYEGDAKDLDIALMNEVPEDFQWLTNFEKGKDTLNFWYSAIETDSLHFEVTKNDFKETYKLKLRSTEIDSLAIKANISSTINPRDTFSISTNVPIIAIDSTKFSLLDKDSIAVPFTTSLTSYKNKLFINFKKEFNNKYAIQILPDGIKDVFGLANDTLNYKFSTKLPEDYGNINITLNNVASYPVIVEMIDKKGELIDSKYSKTPEVYRFKNLKPATYIVRVIYDVNKNGLWDTGNFLLKTQPEEVQYFETEMELRANWDLEETFQLN